MANQWFDVDKEGLAKLIGHQGKGRLICELLQNALDEEVTSVTIILRRQVGRTADLSVIDDSPEGFQNLAHAYTLFADSYKKHDPRKRGRFNFGEKLVLAMCRLATISTTTGKVSFGSDGKRIVHPRRKRSRGSEFRARINMTREEYDDVCRYMHAVLIPTGVQVTFNGQVLEPRQPIHSFEASLDTVAASTDGFLKNLVRKTRIELYEPRQGEVPTLFELGLPVVETQDRWHVNIGQKVPLNLDRDNVRPTYLKKLRTLILNEMHDKLSSEDANTTWVQEATSHADCSHPAINKFLDLRFGENRASYDPTDPEAGKRIQSAGGTVVTGSMLNGRQWQKAKEANAIQPAGAISPTPRPYNDDPNAPTEKVVPPELWTAAIQNIVAYAKFLAKELMNVTLAVKITQTKNNFLACYGHGQLTFNLQRLSHQWFEQGPTENVDELLIHEFGHEYCGDHLSDKYHEALSRLGAKLKRLALEKPEDFKIYSQFP